MKNPVVWFLVVLVVLGLILWRGCGPGGPIIDRPRDAHIDSAKIVQTMDSTALAHADSVLAQVARDSSVERLVDSAAVLGRKLDSLDRVAARLRRANQARKDSLAAARQTDSNTVATYDSAADTSTTAPFQPDTVTLLANPDTGDVSCESRYAGRLGQITLMGEAIERCRMRGDIVRVALIGVRDTLALTKHYLHASDSLLLWERDRDRPCQVDLGLKKVSCGTAIGGASLLSALATLLVAH